MNRRSIYTALASVFTVGTSVACSENNPVATPVAFTAVSAAASGYEKVDLGTLGGNYTAPFAIDDRGRIVGWSEEADGSQVGFVWEDGVMRALPRSAVFFRNVATVTNKSGLIAGFDEGVPSVLFWRDANATPVRIDDRFFDARKLFLSDAVLVGGFQDGPKGYGIIWREPGVSPGENIGGLDPSGAVNTDPADVNNKGQIVGRSQAYFRRSIQGAQFRPFLWENGVMQNLGLLGYHDCEDGENADCGYGEAWSVNDHGVVVGSSSTGGDGPLHAFVWSDGQMTDLGPGQAHAINDRGQILGVMLGGNSFNWVVWDRGVPRSIGSFGGFTQPLFLGEDGTVGGYSTTADGAMHAFLWHDGEMTDLGPGVARAINADGDVIGTTNLCQFQFCQPRGILWRRVKASL